jgi:hypothetical protein
LKTANLNKFAAQATAATISAIKVILRTLLAVQAAQASLFRAVNFGIRAQQSSVAFPKRAVTTSVRATQGQSVGIARVIGKMLRAVQATLARISTFLPGAAIPRRLYFTASRAVSMAMTASRNIIRTLIASEEQE